MPLHVVTTTKANQTSVLQTSDSTMSRGVVAIKPDIEHPCSTLRAAATRSGLPPKAVTPDMCSNAGFLFFGTVLRAIAAAEAKELHNLQIGKQPPLQHSMLQAVQGMILDSAPCRLTPDISARQVCSCNTLCRSFPLTSLRKTSSQSTRFFRLRAQSGVVWTSQVLINS